jgi:hypothetical protein
MANLKQTIAWLHALLGIKARDERGFSISIEQLMWIIGIALIATAVIAVLNGYINGLLARL